jgi:hypothetical protein
MVLCVPRVQASYWSYRRPSSDRLIDQRIDNSYSDGKASVGLGVHISNYLENNPYYDYNDVLLMRVVATSNSRKILSYVVGADGYNWHDGLDYSLYLGDDDGAWVEFGGVVPKARFYGGVGSAEYGCVFVSSNGVVFFNYSWTGPSYSATIPSPTAPNSFAAPFWRDLKPNLGGSITYGVRYHPPAGKDCFVVSWNNVPDAYGIPQTFQVVIEPAPSWTPHGSESYIQSRIWFQYKSITLNAPTTVGIEDQEGYRGAAYNYLNLTNGTALKFEQNSNYAAIISLKIELIENDAYAFIDIDEDPDWIRGINVYLQQGAQPDPLKRFALALAGGAALLIPGDAGLIIGVMLWLPEFAGALAGLLKEAQPDQIVDYQPTSYAFAYAKEPNYQLLPVDALFGIGVRWIFTDPNTLSHYLTINAKLTYAEFNQYGTHIETRTIETSVNLHIYVSGGGGGDKIAPQLTEPEEPLYETPP